MSVPSAAESGRPTEATIRVGDVDVHVAGDGARTLLMVHGWPDTWRLWDAQVAALAGRYRCVRFSLPGFEPGAPVRGHSLAEITQALAAIADAVSPSAPVVLMVHDWGCLFGYEFSRAHPDRVERIIGLDIGDAGSRAHRDSITAGQMAMIFGYRHGSRWPGESVARSAIADARWRDGCAHPARPRPSAHA
ncbi:MAG: alpha/beta fold hydrolase [Burkholderiaceae bacterium]